MCDYDVATKRWKDCGSKDCALSNKYVRPPDRKPKKGK